MLRIWVVEDANEIGITLEGRVAGSEVAELNRAWAETAPRLRERRLWVDLRTVTDTDAEGRALLALIYAQTQARLITRTLGNEYLALAIMYGKDDRVYAQACE